MIGFRNALKLVYSDVLARLRPANIAMLHIGRVGSTVVTGMLHQHTQIYWGGEFFHPDSLDRWQNMFGEESPERLLRLVMPAARRGFFGFDCKMFADPARLHLSTEQFIQSLLELKFDHFIFLERKNLLRRFISIEVGKRRGTWHLTDGAPELIRVRVDPKHPIKRNATKSLIDWFEDYTSVYDAARRQVAAYPTLNLTYEEDVLPGPHTAYEKICAFLGVAPEEPVIKRKKISPFPLEDLLTNYEEVNVYLQDTPYAWMLQDEKQYT